MIALFGLFAGRARPDLRTDQGRASGGEGQRPAPRPTQGRAGQSKLDGKEEEIRMLFGKEVSKASIAKIVDVSRTILLHFVR